MTAYTAANPVFAPTGGAARSLRAQGALWTPLNVLAYTTKSYCMINILYDLLALLAVGTGCSAPACWPPPFGRWRDAYTVRRFWG